METIRALFLTTLHNKAGHDTDNVWLEELAAPYYIFKDAGADVTIALSNNGPVSVNLSNQPPATITQSAKRFLEDAEAMNFFSNTILLEEIKADDFDLVFIPGANNFMQDVTNNRLLKQLLQNFSIKQKPIGAASHGVAGLVSLLNDKGEPLIKEKLPVSTNRVMPFLLGNKMAFSWRLE